MDNFTKNDAMTDFAILTQEVLPEHQVNIYLREISTYPYYLIIDEDIDGSPIRANESQGDVQILEWKAQCQCGAVLAERATRFPDDDFLTADISVVRTLIEHLHIGRQS